jgi:hypothetical protein
MYASTIHVPLQLGPFKLRVLRLRKYVLATLTVIEDEFTCSVRGTPVSVCIGLYLGVLAFAR